MKRECLIALTTILLAAGGPAVAAEQGEDAGSKISQKVSSYPMVPIPDVLESVTRKSGRTFLVDARVRPELTVGQIKTRDLTYSSLLSILRNNGLAACTVGGVTNIMPADTIRQCSLPVLHAADETIDAEEWVTWVVRLENANPAQLVPIMRPLLPKQGHLAANPASNTIIIVDRYANALRVVEMMLNLDARTLPQAE